MRGRVGRDRTHVRSLGVIRHATMSSFGATSVQLKRGKNRAFSRKRRQGNGLEFFPSWFVARRSIQLSYGRTDTVYYQQLTAVSHSISTSSVSVLWGSEGCFSESSD